MMSGLEFCTADEINFCNYFLVILFACGADRHVNLQYFTFSYDFLLLRIVQFCTIVHRLAADSCN